MIDGRRGTTRVGRVVTRTLSAVWEAPRVPAPARGPWWRVDVVLVAVLVPTAVVEVFARDDVPWPPYTLTLTLVGVVAVLWRTCRPLLAVVVAYGAQTLAGVVPALAGEAYGIPYTNAVVLLLAYSLSRWASGRHVLAGTVLLLLGHFTREPLYGSSVSEDVVGAAVLLLPVALGAAVRWWALARGRQREAVRHHERERLARDLHDTVAHHVSGIVITAQAGRTVAARDPAWAAASLRVVEETAALALADMRSVVGLLRGDGETARRAPVHGVADLHRPCGPSSTPRGCGWRSATAWRTCPRSSTRRSTGWSRKR